MLKILSTCLWFILHSLRTFCYRTNLPKWNLHSDISISVKCKKRSSTWIVVYNQITLSTDFGNSGNVLETFQSTNAWNKYNCVTGNLPVYQVHFIKEVVVLFSTKALPQELNKYVNHSTYLHYYRFLRHLSTVFHLSSFK